MKFPAVLKRDAATALQKAREDLAAVEAQIASLQSERLEKLIDAEPGEIERIDRRIGDFQRQQAVFADRIRGLVLRLEDEQRALSKTRYEAAVGKMDALLARRAKAADQVERALANLAGAVKEFMAATAATLEAWPADVEFPTRAYPAHALSLERLGGLVRDIFTPSRGLADKRPPTPAEYLTRAADADRHRAFAAIERELCEQWLADLKTAHDPPPAETETENEEAA